MLTAGQCEDELRRLSKKLEDRTDSLADLLDEAAEAEVVHKVAFAKALLRHEGTNPIREAHATEDTEALLRDRKHKEAIADACREAVRSLRDQLSAVQSANANVRHQSGLA